MPLPTTEAKEILRSVHVVIPGHDWCIGALRGI